MNSDTSMTDDLKASTGWFDVQAIAKTLPETATTLLADTYLTDRDSASARIFRVYRPTPAHYHASCDEYLYVLSGRGTFWMKDPSTKAEFAPGATAVLRARNGARDAGDLQRAAGVLVD